MEYTPELEDWINETVDHYLLKMRSLRTLGELEYRPVYHDVNVILHKETMQLFEKSWTEWDIKHGFEPRPPIPYSIEDSIEQREDGMGIKRINLIHGAMYKRIQDGNQYFILMWLNLEWFHDLDELQQTIVHELVHLEYPLIPHSPTFDALIDMYLNTHITHQGEKSIKLLPKN